MSIFFSLFYFPFSFFFHVLSSRTGLKKKEIFLKGNQILNVCCSTRTIQHTQASCIFVANLSNAARWCGEKQQKKGRKIFSADLKTKKTKKKERSFWAWAN
jgi:hypothetical protein